jgi:hypothetical protein
MELIDKYFKNTTFKKMGILKNHEIKNIKKHIKPNAEISSRFELASH